MVQKSDCTKIDTACQLNLSVADSQEFLKISVRR